MLFSLLKHYLDLYISDTALKVFRSLYCFTTCIGHGVENYFSRLWGTGISDAVLFKNSEAMHLYPFHTTGGIPHGSGTGSRSLSLHQSHKVAYEPRTVVEGQGCSAQCL